MSTKIPVSEVYRYLDMMLRDRWGYIYGTAGVDWTAEKQAKLKAKYSEDDKNYGNSVKYGKQWIGHKVSDCSGVLVYIYKQFGLSIPHGSSSMVRNKYIINCGPTPHPGWAALVDPTPDTPDNKHIGIVGADGVTVYEAKGAKAGFTTSKVTDSKWRKFGELAAVDYGKEVEPVPTGKQVNYKAEVTTKSGSLNIRNGPGIDPHTGKLYDKIGSVPKGTIVDVWTECDNGWRYIDDDGDTGYVDGQYLTKLPDDSPAPDDPPKTVKTTVLRRWSDGVEIVLEGDWQIVYSTVGDE